MIKISATANAGKENERSSEEFDYDLPETLEGCVEKYTEAIVLEVFKAQVVVKAQSYIRGLLLAIDKETGLPVNSNAEIESKFAKWKLIGGNRTKLSPMEKLVKLGLSKKDILALVASMPDNEEGEEEIEEEFEDDETELE